LQNYLKNAHLQLEKSIQIEKEIDVITAELYGLSARDIDVFKKHYQMLSGTIIPY
jgi:hypothetical protein